MAAVLLAERVADRESAAPGSGGVLVAVLNEPEPARVPRLDLRVSRMDVDARDVPDTVGGARDRKNEAGAEDVRYLKPGVVLTVPEGRHLDETVVFVSSRPEALREDGMGDHCVEAWAAAVDDHQASVVSILKQMLERLAHGLNRERVHCAPIQRNADLLDPHSPEDARVVSLQKLKKLVEEPEREPASAMTLPHHAAELGSFDLDKRVIQKVRRPHPTPKEATLQCKEIARELREDGGVQNEPTEDKNRRYLSVGGRDCLNVAGVVDVRDLHEASRYDYGHSRWP